jgi:hypothetical protein
MCRFDGKLRHCCKHNTLSHFNSDYCEEDAFSGSERVAAAIRELAVISCPVPRIK